MSYAHVYRKATKLECVYKEILAYDAIVINSWFNFVPNLASVDNIIKINVKKQLFKKFKSLIDENQNNG